MKYIVKVADANVTNTPYRTYETNNSDIWDAINKFGRTYDKILICTENDIAVAGAEWPTGWKDYRIMTSIELDDRNETNPMYRGM